MLSISAIYHTLYIYYVADCSVEYLALCWPGCVRAWRGHLLDGRIRQNLPKYPGVVRGGPPAHMALYLAASTAHTYNIHLSTFPARGSPPAPAAPQPGAGSPGSRSTNIVIYLSSSRQSPASGAPPLGHSHTFTSPTLAQLCPWPSPAIASNIFALHKKLFLYRFYS